MRKYWKSIAMIVGIVLCIGTFHVSSARSAEHYPEFVITMLSGDVKEVESLVLDASYTDTSAMNYTTTNVDITPQGSSFQSRSFLNQIIGQYPRRIRELQEEYRSFMRGKNPWENLYFENNDLLLYADADYQHTPSGPKDFNFEISVLNKTDGESTSFTLEMPNREELQYVLVADVQFIENTAYVITQNTVSKRSEFHEEMHVYEIDLANQSITSHETVVEYSGWQGNSSSYLHLVERNQSLGANHLVMVKTDEAMTDDVESSRVTDRNREIIHYDLLTKQTETIEVPDLSLDENHLSFVDGETLYFARAEEEELVVISYQLGEDQIEAEYRIRLQSAFDQDYGPLPLLHVTDGKLFVVNPQSDSTTNGFVAVLDMQTGETLFKGEIALENSSEPKRDFELYIQSINLK